MKKSEILTLTVALAGSVAAMMPQVAAADTCGSVTTSSTPGTCSISGGYLAEELVFTGSKGVQTNYLNDAAYFSACGWHIQGKSSFGMSTQSTEMYVRTATGKATNASSGCAA